MHPLVRIRWTDAYFEYESDGSQPIDYEVSTVGYLVAEGPTFVSIAAEVLPGGSFRAVTHIPAAIVVAVIPLQELDEELREPGSLPVLRGLEA